MLGIVVHRPRLRKAGTLAGRSGPVRCPGAMTGLLPIIFALIILDTSRSAHPLHPQPWLWWGILFAASLVAWVVLSELMARVLGRLAERHWLERWDDGAHLLLLGWLAWICFGCGWTARVDAYTPAILPWVVMQTAHWWCLATGLRGGDPHRAWARYRLILQQLRFGMLPMLVLLPVFDVCNWMTLRTGLQPWMLHHLGLPVTMTIASLALGLAALVLMPAVLVWLWRSRPLADGPLRADLEQACAHLGVGVRRILLFPSDGGRVYNAAVIGAVPVLRYVLFTEDLVRDFPRAQVRAVLGHELGHARHHHLVLYLLFALATLLVAALAADPLTAALGHWTWAARWSEPVRRCAVTLVLAAIKWRLIFGYLSRACERQADLIGAQLCGDPLVMRAALKQVAARSGQSEEAPSWRHYSIAQRALFLEQVAADPALAARHHRIVRVWWSILVVLVLALGAILAIIALGLWPVR